MTTFIEIKIEEIFEIGQGYGVDANYTAIKGRKKISFGFVNEEYQNLPKSGRYEAKEILQWAVIPKFVKDWIKKE
jgi:hypothetical protein